MAYTPSAEMQKVIDIVRAANRRIYERADTPLDELLADAKAEEIHVHKAHEDRENGMWSVYLAYKVNGRGAESGYGADAAEALFHALRRCRANRFKGRDLPPPRLNEGLLAGKTEAERSQWIWPGLDEVPDEDPPWGGDVGPPPTDDEFDSLDGDEPETGGRFTEEDVI